MVTNNVNDDFDFEEVETPVEGIVVSGEGWKLTTFNPEDHVILYRKLVEFIRSVLRPDVDYGIIPGSMKPTLYQPGAQKLRAFFGLQIRIDSIDKIEEYNTPVSWTTFPVFAYAVKVSVYDRDGNFITNSEGSANSLELKYSGRWISYYEAIKDPAFRVAWDKGVVRTKESSEKEFAFAIDKAETSGPYGKPQEYWDSWKAAIENGEAIRSKRNDRSGKVHDAWERNSILVFAPNFAIYDQVNTILKMAVKRAKVSGVLDGTGASDVFTTDLEDMAQFYKDEQPNVMNMIPTVNDAKIHLLNHVIKLTGYPKDTAGKFIKTTLENAGLAFSLDNWAQIITAIEQTVFQQQTT